MNFSNFRRKKVNKKKPSALVREAFYVYGYLLDLNADFCYNYGIKKTKINGGQSGNKSRDTD